MTDPEWRADDTTLDEAAFPGVARLFPLPSVALVPGVVQPLHVFEERYRALAHDALAGDRLVAMAVLKPGWETDYEGRPPLEPVACLGRIVTHHRLDDGRYNLLVAGLRRVWIDEELSPPLAFRRARVRLVEEVVAPPGAETKDLARRLAGALRRGLPGGDPPPALRRALEGDAPLGLLTDLVALLLPLRVATKRAALCEVSVARRAELVLAAAQTLAEVESSSEDYLPPFSQN